MSLVSSFKDYFSLQAADYAKYRPLYPEALFKTLADLSPSYQCAWDCATGNGQAAVSLARIFAKVYATDPSQSQLTYARAHPRIKYSCVPAESPGLAAESCDLITVAQAIHWFQLDVFYKNVQKILKPNGILAFWSYGGPKVNTEIDQWIVDFNKTLKPFAAPELKLVDDKYRTLQFPFDELESPDFEMKIRWTRKEYFGHLFTWSATQAALKATSQNPLEK